MVSPNKKCKTKKENQVEEFSHRKFVVQNAADIKKKKGAYAQGKAAMMVGKSALDAKVSKQFVKSNTLVMQAYPRANPAAIPVTALLLIFSL